jgi:CBS domain-containing protein
MPFMDVELSEVRDFLARHAPFDALPDEVLSGIPRHCTLRYARRGAVVLEVGQEGDGGRARAAAARPCWQLR